MPRLPPHIRAKVAAAAALDGGEDLGPAFGRNSIRALDRVMDGFNHVPGVRNLHWAVGLPLAQRLLPWRARNTEFDPVDSLEDGLGQCSSLHLLSMMFDSVGITVDCSAETVDVLAEFWSAALGYAKLLPFLLIDPTGVQPRIVFHAVPEPKTVKNRWHLDLYVDHLDKLGAEIERVTTLGATKVRDYDDVSHGFTNTFAVMLDPAGNEFCVCAPHIPVASSGDG